MPLQKSTEQGWFYHAPARPQNTGPMEAPAPSQIPGLSNVDLGVDDPVRSVYRDTDSDYVRLAKKGGRDDLLQNNYSQRGRSKEAVAYPRVDWFYLEDNRAEDQEKTASENKKDYNFLLPEYMVHEEVNDHANGCSFTPQRAPYGFDKTTVYERERDPTLKTVKLPEVMHQGYGVRNEKLKNKVVPHNNPPPPKPYKHTDSKVDPIATNAMTRPRPRPMPNVDGKEKTVMSKILAFDYGKDWEQARDNWKKEQPDEEKTGQMKNQDIFSSEYQTGFSKGTPKRGRRVGSQPQTDNEEGSPSPIPSEFSEGRPPPKTAAQGVQKPSATDKEPFKMSRFKNVPARTESHRPVPALS